MRYVALFSSLLLAVLSPHLCRATIIHVPAEYSTIQAGINAASEGDTVLVAPGTYRETLRLKKNVRVQGAGIDLSVVDVSADTRYIYTVISGEDGAELEGFTVMGGDSVWSGISCWSSPMLIRGNKITGCDCAVAVACSAVIIDNTIINNRDYGLFCGSSTDFGPLISKNLILNSDGAIVSVSSNLFALNNTVDNNERGIWIQQYSEDTTAVAVTAKNNIISNNDRYGVYLASGYPYGVDTSLMTIDYNDVWNNNPNYSSNWVQDSTDISEDPLFVLPVSPTPRVGRPSEAEIIHMIEKNNELNAHYSSLAKGEKPRPKPQIQPRLTGSVSDTVYDYHLQENSPCINKGDPDPIYNDPDGTRNDMGAFYFDQSFSTIIGLLVKNTSTLDNEEIFATQLLDSLNIFYSLIDPNVIVAGINLTNYASLYCVGEAQPFNYNDSVVIRRIRDFVSTGKVILVEGGGCYVAQYLGLGTVKTGSWLPVVSDAFYFVKPIISHPAFAGIETWEPPSSPDPPEQLIYQISPGSITYYYLSPTQPFDTLEYRYLQATYGWPGQNPNDPNSACDEYPGVCTSERVVRDGYYLSTTVGNGTLIALNESAPFRKKKVGAVGKIIRQNILLRFFGGAQNVEISSPDSGEIWCAGNTYDILWNSNFIDSVKIEYSTDRGSSWDIISASTASTGGYSWEIPDSLPTSSHCRVRICDTDGSPCDAGNSEFTILRKPVVVSLVFPPNGALDVPINPVRLEWRVVADVDSYNLQVDTDSGFTSPVFEEIGITDSCYHVSELDSGITYYWRVNAINQCGVGEWSGAWHFTAGPEALAQIMQFSPADQESVDYRSNVAVTFSKSIDPSTIDNNSVSIKGWKNYNWNFLTEDGLTFIFSPNSGFYSLDTLKVILTDKIKDILGRGIDLDGDTSWIFYVYPLGDYNQDMRINGDDLPDFTYAWNAQDTSKEIGPADGTPPHLLATPDGRVDFEDLVIFVWMWNWFHEKASFSPSIYAGDKTTDFDDLMALTPDSHIGQNESKKFDLVLKDVKDVMVVSIILQYDPAKLQIESVAEGSLLSKDGANTLFLRSIDNDRGIAEIACSRLKGDPPGVEGQIPVAQITIRALTHLDDEPILIHYEAWDSQAKLLYLGRSSMTLNSAGLFPRNFELLQNFPNPFNPQTRISYNLPRSSQVKVTVYNIVGEKVKTLVDEFQAPGRKLVYWDGTDDSGRRVASGVYFYKIQTGEFTESKKMIILK
jgi:hypothetical protein